MGIGRPVGVSDETGLTGWVVSLTEALGSPGAGLAVALENVFPPLPSEVILPLAGFTAHQGGLNLVAAIVWTTLGSVVGSLVLYYLGVLLGRDRLRRIADKLPLVDVADVDRADRWFARHGRAAVLFGRMVPVVRSLISIPAGVNRMPLPTFLLFTALGSGIWNTALIMAGYLLGTQWHLIEQYASTATTIVLIAAAVAIAWLIISRLRRRSRT